MFAQLMLHCRLKQLGRGGILYDKGNLSDCFYFVLKGDVHVTMLDGKETRPTKTMEEGMIFGFRDSCLSRDDFATSKQADTEVIEIPSFQYKEIITQTQQL